MAVTNTASPALDPNIDPKTNKPKAPAPATGAQGDVGAPGATATTTAPAPIGAQKAPAPVIAPAPVANNVLAPEQIAPGANVSLFTPEFLQNKKDIAEGQNAKELAMQAATIADRRAGSPHMGIGGHAITDANPRGDAGGSPFGSPMRFLSEAERQAKVAENNAGKPAEMSYEEFQRSPHRQATISERNIYHINPNDPNPDTRKGVGPTSGADLARQQASAAWLADPANNGGKTQHERYVSAPAETFLEARRKANPQLHPSTGVEVPNETLPSTESAAPAGVGARVWTVDPVTQKGGWTYESVPERYRPDGAFGGSPSAAKPDAKKKR